MSKGTYLVLGFIPDYAEFRVGYGVHTPLRSDGYYGSPPTEVATSWRREPIHPNERVVVVQIVDDGSEETSGGSNGL